MTGLTPGQRELAAHRRRQAFEDWVEALRLRAVMEKVLIEPLTADERKEYERPTKGFK